MESRTAATRHVAARRRAAGCRAGSWGVRQINGAVHTAQVTACPLPQQAPALPRRRVFVRVGEELHSQRGQRVPPCRARRGRSPRWPRSRDRAALAAGSEPHRPPEPGQRCWLLGATRRCFGRRGRWGQVSRCGSVRVCTGKHLKQPSSSL